MPAALRTRLRPPSHPTRYSARSGGPSESARRRRRVVLREPRHLTSAVDGHLELGDPAGHDALDVVLPQPQRVGMPSGEVADVQTDPGELPDLDHLSFRKEPIGDSPLVEDLDGS